MTTYVDFAGLNGVSKSGDQSSGLTYTFSAEGVAYNANMYLPASTDGWFQVTINSLCEFAIGFSTSNAEQNFDVWQYSLNVYSGDYNAWGSGSDLTENGTQPADPANGHWVRVERSGSNVLLKVSTNSGGAWTTVHTFSSASSAVLYPKLGMFTSGSVNGAIHSGLVEPDLIAGTPVYGSTSLSIPYSGVGTIAAGDTLICIVATKPDTATVNTPTGGGTWAAIGSQYSGGGGTTGADTGPTKIAAYSLTADGDETGNVSVSITSGNSSWGMLIKLQGSWSLASAGGTDSTTGGTWAVTCGSDPGITANDICIAASCIPTDITTPSQFSAHSITATGISAWSAFEELVEPDSGTGNDIGGFVFYGTATTGTSSAAPVVGATAGGTTTNVRGPTILVRARESATSASLPLATAAAAALALATAPVQPASLPLPTAAAAALAPTTAPAQPASLDIATASALALAPTAAQVQPATIPAASASAEALAPSSSAVQPASLPAATAGAEAQAPSTAPAQPASAPAAEATATALAPSAVTPAELPSASASASALSPVTVPTQPASLSLASATAAAISPSTTSVQPAALPAPTAEVTALAPSSTASQPAQLTLVAAEAVAQAPAASVAALLPVCTSTAAALAPATAAVQPASLPAAAAAATSFSPATSAVQPASLPLVTCAAEAQPPAATLIAQLPLAEAHATALSPATAPSQPASATLITALAEALAVGTTAAQPAGLPASTALAEALAPLTAVLVELPMGTAEAAVLAAAASGAQPIELPLALATAVSISPYASGLDPLELPVAGALAVALPLRVVWNLGRLVVVRAASALGPDVGPVRVSSSAETFGPVRVSTTGPAGPIKVV